MVKCEQTGLKRMNGEKIERSLSVELAGGRGRAEGGDPDGTIEQKGRHREQIIVRSGLCIVALVNLAKED